MIESPERRLRVHDFLPNTRLDSHIAGGEIQVQQTESVDQGVHGNVGASANVLYNAVPITIGPSIGGNNNNKTTTTRKYSEVAPHELVLASGTTNREHGVYFKLKPTRENTLEGAKEFFALFVVPQQWRGDWARVTCVAKCRCKWCIGSDDRTCGTASRLVGLHLVDDGQARQIAQAIATVQDKQQKPSFLGLDRAFSKILPVSSRNDRAAERLPSLNELLDAMGELSANTSSVHRVQRALMPAD